MNILIFSNCAGNIIKKMFQTHPFTKNSVKVNYIANYENIVNESISKKHKEIITSCDIFIYQPFNKHFDNTEYDIKNVKKLLKKNVVIYRINYYRFRGFWYNSEYKPYHSYKNYNFLNMDYYGIPNFFVGKNNLEFDDVKKLINNFELNETDFNIFFNNCINNLEVIDKNSDVDMLTFFLNNYRKKKLFHDPFHPTNIFFYEIFRQIVSKIFEYELPIDDELFIMNLNNIEMVHWALPILPQIRKTLNLSYEKKIGCGFGSKGVKMYLDIYQYIFIRLNINNFKSF